MTLILVFVGRCVKSAQDGMFHKPRRCQSPDTPTTNINYTQPSLDQQFNTTSQHLRHRVSIARNGKKNNMHSFKCLCSWEGEVAKDRPDLVGGVGRLGKCSLYDAS